VEDALNKGCRLAITERKDLAGKGRVVVVSSTLEVLQQLAHYHRMQVAPRLIAITGSNGKTTTKELLAAVLSKEYTLLATRGNLNNHIGVPLTLLKLNREELALVEMGANHPGEIAELARIAAPEVGLITNVGKAHLEGFGSLQGVLDAKSELYAYLAKHGGTAIIDGRDQKLMRKADELGVACKVVAPKGDLPVAVTIFKTSCLQLQQEYILESQGMPLQELFRDIFPITRDPRCLKAGETNWYWIPTMPIPAV
jgi:UDP-N-acetylmuramyl pentapeptide synthase